MLLLHPRLAQHPASCPRVQGQWWVLQEQGGVGGGFPRVGEAPADGRGWVLAREGGGEA